MSQLNPARALQSTPFAAHDLLRSDLNFDTIVHTVVLEYNCLITDNLVESTRLAEAKQPAESGPAFDPLGSISGLGSKVTGAGSEVRICAWHTLRCVALVLWHLHWSLFCIRD